MCQIPLGFTWKCTFCGFDVATVCYFVWVFFQEKMIEFVGSGARLCGN